MKTRIISAAVALVIAIVVLLLHNTFVFNLSIGLISALAIAEIFKATKRIKFTIPAVMCCAYAVIDAFMPVFYRKGWLLFFSPSLYFGLFVLGMCLFYLKFYETYKYKDLFFMIGVGSLIPYSFGTIISMASYYKGGVFLVVLTLSAAWLADSGAYFAGTFFGKTKLCPNISPKKTVEGLVGGVISNGILMLLIALVFDLFTDSYDPRYFFIFLSGMIAALVGLVGDLTASEIKRQCGIKDYGNIMPGHGGVMDRFDSVLMVAPFMYYMFSQGLLIK